MSEPADQAKSPEPLQADDLADILKRNPHKRWSYLWRRWRKLQVLYQDFRQMRVGLDDWEREVLIPQLKGRLAFMSTLLTEVKKICANTNVRDQIGPAVMALGAVPPNVDARKVTQEYLDKVSSQVDADFLIPIEQALKEAEQGTEMRSLLRFVNSVRFLASLVTSTEATLFWYSSWIHVYVVDKATGQRVGPSETREYALILLPFKHVIGNLMGVATTTIANIDQWQKQLQERQKPFVEYAGADALYKANRNLVWFQVFVIVLTLAASYFFAMAADPIGSFRKVNELQEQLRKADQSNTTLKFDLQRKIDSDRALREENERLKSQLQTAKPAQKAPKKK